MVGGGEHSTDVWRALHFGSGVRDVLLSRLQSALELPLDLAKTGFDHKIRNEPRAEQGATANAHVRHASCWAMNLNLDMDNPADREKLRRAILDLVAGRKMPKQKGRG